MSASGRDRSGRVRIRCSAAKESGTCSSPKTFYLDHVEELVLRSLCAELKRPEAISEYLRAYHEERRRLRASGAALKSSKERRLIELCREIDRLLDAIAKGHIEPEIAGPRIRIADTEKKRLETELAEAAPIDNVISFHPTLIARYEEQLRNLSMALQAGMDMGDGEASSALRDLIDHVTVFREDDRLKGLRVEIAGRLNALLDNGTRDSRVWGFGGSGRGADPKGCRDGARGRCDGAQALPGAAGAAA
jgi:hypothetical protein